MKRRAKRLRPNIKNKKEQVCTKEQDNPKNLYNSNEMYNFKKDIKKYKNVIKYPCIGKKCKIKVKLKYFYFSSLEPVISLISKEKNVKIQIISLEKVAIVYNALIGMGVFSNGTVKFITKAESASKMGQYIFYSKEYNIEYIPVVFSPTEEEKKRYIERIYGNVRAHLYKKSITQIIDDIKHNQLDLNSKISPLHSKISTHNNLQKSLINSKYPSTDRPFYTTDGRNILSCLTYLESLVIFTLVYCQDSNRLVEEISKIDPSMDNIFEIEMALNTLVNNGFLASTKNKYRIIISDAQVQRICNSIGYDTNKL